MTATWATCSRCRTRSPPACRRRWRPEIFRAEASAPARSSSTDLTAWDRFLKGLSHYYQQTKADFEASIALFREAIALDPSLAIARAYLATIMLQGVQFGWISSTSELWAEAMELAESSVRLDPRSSFAFSILSYVHAMEGITRRRWMPEEGRRAQSRTTWARAAFSAYVTSSSASIARRSNCFRRRCSMATPIPAINGRPCNAFSHYLLRQYDASLSWAREVLYLNPNHLQVLAVRAAALAQLGRDRGSGKGDRSPARQLSGPDGRKALAEFPLEESGRYRALS